MSGKLYLVSTPIGNLSDISQRAIEVLDMVDLVACEDTRHTGKLLKHLGLRKQLISYHEHNEGVKLPHLIEKLKDGSSIALVSDAGTPTISDPGFGLVSSSRERGIEVTVVPGPTALISALVLSGFPTDAFYFGGFLPSKKGPRRKTLQQVADIKATLVFYESPRRIGKSLRDCSEVLGNRSAAVVREITKLHEEVIGGNLTDLAERLEGESVKGEIVLVIDRARKTPSFNEKEKEEAVLRCYDRFIDSGMSPKEAVKKAAREVGMPKSDAYRLVEKRKNNR